MQDPALFAELGTVGINAFDDVAVSVAPKDGDPQQSAAFLVDLAEAPQYEMPW